VEGQATGNYACALAERGFAALAFDRPGVVRAFSMAVYSIVESHLATGERRQLPLFSAPRSSRV
jgi:hypothetical protein